MTPPILGIWASQISGHLWAPAGAYDALATVTVPSGGVSSVTFSGIPTGYKHLQLRAIYKTSATSGGSPNLRFNGDTGSSYPYHGVTGTGASTYAYGYGSQTFINFGDGTQSTSNFGATVIDILDYTNTSKNKTVRALSGVDNNGSGTIGLYSGGWMNTAAITSINLFPQSANFSEFSQFALYGVR